MTEVREEYNTNRLRIGLIERSYSNEIGLILGEVFSVSSAGTDKIKFTEECDGHYKEIMSKKEALFILREITKYIIGLE